RLARDFPDLQLFLGHTGVPEERDDEYFAFWRKSIAEVAAFPNVAIKISGLGMRDRSWTLSSIRPWVLAAIEAFGPDRCMFGTNWPVDRLFSDLATLVDAYRQIISGFSDGEQAALLRRNAERYYWI